MAVFLLFALVAAVFVGLVGVVVYVVRFRPSSGGGTGGATAAGAGTRIRPNLSDFHVRGDAAHVTFAVPVPDGPVDGHLRTVLEHEAVAVLREKRDHGLPLEDVKAIVVYAQRGSEAVQVGRVELPAAGSLPEVVAPDLLPHDRVAGFDPLAMLDEQDLDVAPGVAVREGEGSLPPVSEAIELPASLEVALRTQGADPARITLSQLVLGLLQAAGYQVTEERGLTSEPSASVYRAQGAGGTNLVAVVEHQPSEHPELSEQVISEMIVRAGQANTSGFVVSDKYGPYTMYERERRSRVRFITRERLQAFVDSFALRP